MLNRIEQIKQLCVCVLLSTVSWCVWDITQHVKATANQLVHEATETRTQSIQMISETRDEMMGQVGSLRQDTFVFLNSLSNKVDHRLISLERNTFTRVDHIQTQTFDKLDRMQTDLSALNHSAVDLLDTYKKPADTLNQLLQANDIYFNCARNSMCWSNQTANTLKQIERTTTSVANSMEQINKSTPKLVTSLEQFSDSFKDNAPKILDNTSDITKNVNSMTKPRWYDRMIGWGVNGSLVYFNLTR
jgi:methyl-accepting chemotaxis protein